MAKKDTYLALLRRGIDENTAQILSDGGIKVGDLKKMDVDTLINNYGLKKGIATSVIDAVKSGPRTSSKQRFLADVLSKDCLLYTSPSPRDRTRSRMPSSA